MKQLLALLLTFALAMSAAPRQGKNPDRVFQLSELRVVTLTVGAKKIKAWLMDTPSKRQEGMMFLKEKDVRIDQGMLFVFAEPQPLSFWMRHTLIDLDIAYLDKTGKVLNALVMKALDESGHPSKGQALYALEMKKGAFKRFGIKAGSKIGIPAGVRAAS